MDLSEAITLGGATILVSVLVEVLKRSLAWGQAQVDRFGPLVAVVVGILVVVLLAAAMGNLAGPDPAQAVASAIITGVLAGAAASGLYDGTKVVALVATRTPQDGPGGPEGGAG